MQSEGLVPGSDPGALKVTISKFYRPSGKSTQLEGVKADIVIPSLTDLPEIGESDLGNPMPWDTIPAAKYTESNRVNGSLATLRTRSGERIAKDPDFTGLKTEIERFRKMREEKSVSLNEEQRRKEKTELAERTEATKKERLARASTSPPAYEITLKNVSKPGLGDPVKPKAPVADAKDDKDDDTEVPDELTASPADDIILREAQHILTDYSSLLKGQPVVSQR
jgi:carboxyl-terminal processing protease